MTRDEISALLPFYVNQSLKGDELAAVNAALAGDAELVEEVAALRVMRATLLAEPLHSPGEFGLARLMRAVEADQKAPAPSNLWRIAAAVVLTVFLSQSLYLWLNRNSPDVRLAGDETPGMTVAFAPDATEAAIRDLLITQGLQVVGGPSALGLWVISGPDLAAAAAALAQSPLVESVEAGGDE